jgi:hypothetical protein
VRNPAEDPYPAAQAAVALLNLLTGAKFNPPIHELDQIAARLQETGGDVAGVDKMLRRQVALWKDDPKSRAWLKPGTLFGPNFHDYYGQRDLIVVKTAPPDFRKSRAQETDRSEALHALAATRAALEENPGDPALTERVRALEMETA